MLGLKKKFYIKNGGTSPTLLNIKQQLLKNNWSEGYFKYFSSFNDDILNFNNQVSERLEFKHLFADLCKKYCPNDIPKSYFIDENNWHEVISLICNNYTEEDGIKWILKPSTLNNGQNIKIFEKISDLARHYVGNNRLGGPHILQEYVQDIDLIYKDNKYYKYSVRLFMVICSQKGAYVYSDGYYNIALNSYNKNNIQDLRCHITNEHLSHDESNVCQIPSWKIDSFETSYPKMKEILIKINNGLISEFSNHFKEIRNKKQTLAIFGMDFLIDKYHKPYIIEANHGPCFPTDGKHPLQNELYSFFWEEFYNEFIKKQKSSKFICLNN